MKDLPFLTEDDFRRRLRQGTRQPNGPRQGTQAGPRTAERSTVLAPAIAETQRRAGEVFAAGWAEQFHTRMQSVRETQASEYDADKPRRANGGAYFAMLTLRLGSPRGRKLRRDGRNGGPRRPRRRGCRRRGRHCASSRCRNRHGWCPWVPLWNWSVRGVRGRGK